MKNHIKKMFFILALLTVSVGCEEDSSSSVYICTGNYAYAYHANSRCSGLNNCKGDIISISLSKAKKKGRKACDICY